MFIYDYSSNYLKKYLFSGQKGDLYAEFNLQMQQNSD